MYTILSKKSLNNVVDQMVIEAPFVAKNAMPGHFVILRVDEEGERVPLTIVDHDETTITIVYQRLGYSTTLLSNLQVGDELHDFVGPLGNASPIYNVQSILGVAGGVGAAPIYPQLKAYYDKGVNIDLIVGARSKEYLILTDEFEKICDHIYFCTDDGSFGEKGFVTDIIKKILPDHTYDRVLSIGPLIMMKFVVKLTQDTFHIPTDVSLNPIMIDGTGMCGNCRVSINNKTYFACIDGPDFPAEGINFDELLSRQSYYKDEEHVCNLELKLK